MPRPYHSPSSIALGLRCPRAWAERYVRGTNDPDVPWSAFDQAKWDSKAKAWRLKSGKLASAKARSTALGKAVHAVFESWHQGRPPNWRGLPGEIALSGAHLVPHPSECTRLISEGPIGREFIPRGPDVREGMTHGLRVHGILWAGFRDLLAWPTDRERARLGIVTPLVLYDYKSTASIASYALDETGLTDDPQANLYGIDAYELTGERYIDAHWLYLETKAVRLAKPTRIILDCVRAYDVIAPCAALAHELDTLTRPEDARQNTAACSDYGPPGKINCQHHKDNGGTCNPARRSIGALIQARVPKKDTNTMALSPAVQAKLDAIKAAKAEAASAPETETEAAIETVGEAVDPEAPTEPTPPVATESPKAPAPAKPAAPAAPARKAGAKAAAPADGSTAASVIELAAELGVAKAAADAASAKVVEVLGRIAKAVQQ